MKRMKVLLRMILGGCLFLGLLFLPDLYTEAATVTMDGIRYLLLDSGKAGCAELDQDSALSEVYIRNEVEFLGKRYPVDTFRWDEEDFMIDSDNSFGEGWGQADLEEMNTAHESLRKITFAPGITVRGRAISFKRLEEVVFEGEVSYMDEVSYFNCPQLKTIVLPSSYEEPLFGEFGIDIKRCPSVRIVAEESNPYFQVIDNDVYSKDGTILYNVTSSVQNYKVKGFVCHIGDYAFNGNNTIRSVTMPDSVQTVGRYAFGEMKKLSSVRLSKSLRKLEEGVFLGSGKLKKLNVPKSIKRFDGNFGWKKNKLKKIIIRTKNIKKGQFYDLSEKCTVYVRNKKVKKQLRKFYFGGKIIIKKNL